MWFSNLRCAITLAIVSVLVYLLILNLGERYWGVNSGIGKDLNNTEWYKSIEVLMLVSVFIGHHLNTHLFGYCS